MAQTNQGAPPMQGHVAVYCRDPRWRRSVAKALTEAGHSHHEASEPADLRRLLLHQRFDVLAVKLRDREDAEDIALALHGVALPTHGVLAGSPSALLLIPRFRSAGTFRYVPGPLPATELSRLVEGSISDSASEEGAAENGAAAHIEEVDLEEAIEGAAAAVYPQARRKRQRFRTLVSDPDVSAFADPAKLRRALVSLLGLAVELAPRGALVSVEARAGSEAWTIRIRSAADEKRTRARAQMASALQDQTQTLGALARDLHRQGGLLWVEVGSPAAVGLCLTLPLHAPLPTGAEQGTPA